MTYVFAAGEMVAAATDVDPCGAFVSPVRHRVPDVAPPRSVNPAGMVSVAVAPSAARYSHASVEKPLSAGHWLETPPQALTPTCAFR